MPTWNQTYCCATAIIGEYVTLEKKQLSRDSVDVTR